MNKDNYIIYGIFIGMIVFLLFVFGNTVSADSTSFYYPDSEGDATDWTNGNNVYTEDNVYCDVGNYRTNQEWYGFDIDIPLPVGGYVVDGVYIRFTAKETFTFSNPVEATFYVSNDGGDTYSTGKTLTVDGATETSYYLGGSSDDWGVDWSGGELENDDFWLKGYSLNQGYYIDIDGISVQVYYHSTNSPPEDSNVWLSGGRQIDYYYANFSVTLEDPEGDLMNYTMWCKHDTSYVELVSDNDVSNLTVYYNVSKTDYNFTALNTNFYWGIYAEDYASGQSINETYIWKRVLSPMPISSYIYIDDWLFASCPELNATYISQAYFRNGVNNYTFAQAVSNNIIYENCLRYDYDLDFWNYTTVFENYSSVHIKLKVEDYEIWMPVSSTGGDVNESMYDSDYFNISMDNDCWANITINAWFNDSVSDTLEYNYELNSYYVNETVCPDCCPNSSLYDIYNISLNSESWVNITLNSWFNNSPCDLEHNYVLNNQFINSSGGGCSFPIWVRYRDDNISINTNVSDCDGTNTTAYKINDDNWIYIAAFDVAPHIMLFIVLTFFFYFGEKKKSLVLLMLSSVVALVTGVYYAGWEVAVTDRVIGIALILFSLYCGFLGLYYATTHNVE